MVAVDSNILVRYIIRDDSALAKQSEQIIDPAKAASLLLDRIILAEITYVFKAVYNFKKAEISAVLLSLISDKRFTVTDRNLTSLAVNLFTKHQPLSFEDCWLLASVQTGKAATIATFDTALSKRLP